MKELNVKIVGQAPMLMHSDILSDPLNPVTKAHKELTGDRQLKKTEEGQVMIAKSEYLASFYLDPEGRIVLPALNVRKSLIEGARFFKGGKEVERGVVFPDESYVIDYNGPKDPHSMWEDKRFVDARSVVVSRSRLMRYRPVFNEWSVTVKVISSAEIIDADNLLRYWRTAGDFVGLGDFRPLFGRYSVEAI